MPLSREEVEHIARLCRIGLSEEELERFREQLSHILEEFQLLRQVDTESVPPTSHAVALETVMRADVPGPSFSKEEVLANAPRRENDFFQVKAVLEE